MVKFLILGVFLVVASNSRGETLSFADVWRTVTESSPAEEGAKLKMQSVQGGLSRAENHWLPRVYLNGQTYRTNDPGAAFFGLLEQRRVTSADFSPDLLNHPDAQTFSRGALGLDLALYEGGMKQTQVEMYRHMVIAEKFGASQVEIEQYAQSGLAYGSIASIQKQKAKLQDLGAEIAKLIRGYRLGQKSNPVGYSGLLGMKSLANRIDGFIEQLEAQQTASYFALKEMGMKNVDWVPESLDARAFVDRYLTSPTDAHPAPSYKSKAGAEAAQAAFQAAKMEKARYLPKVGAFAESYLFDGNRDNANGYTAGLYLQWSLFDPSDFGKYKEARLDSMAAERFSQASILQENAERKGLLAADRALRSNLARLDDSDRLLLEQTRVSSSLFKNGSINALQFVEILSRRVDLISQRADAEIGLIKTAAERIKKSKFEIPENANSGGRR